MATETYRLYQLAAPGPIENIKIVTAAKPTATTLKKSQILIEVAYAALNPIDYKLVEAGVPARAITGFPFTPGLDFAGTVVAVALDSNFDDIKIGDKVLGRLDTTASNGTLAEYVVADYEGVVRVPEGLSLDKAAGIATTALTAWQVIEPALLKEKSNKIFLNGGGGGVGTYGIQIAKALDSTAHVTTSVSTEKVQLAKNLGADEVIDYKTTKDVIAQLRGSNGPSYTLIGDFVGFSPPGLFRAASDILLAGLGRFRSITPEPSVETARNFLTGSILPTFLGGSQFKFESVFLKQSREQLLKVVELVHEGKVKPIVDNVYSFDEAPQAYIDLKKGHATGKLVVRVKESAE